MFMKSFVKDTLILVMILSLSGHSIGRLYEFFNKGLETYKMLILGQRLILCLWEVVSALWFWIS
jgi:hypothetical protein